MASITQGLFGASPADIYRDRFDTGYSQDLQAVKLDPLQQANLMLRQGGRGIAQGVGAMMGVQDQQLQQAQMAQQLASQYNTTTPEGMTEYAQALAQNGMPEFAQIAVTKAQEMKSKGLSNQQSELNIKKTEQATDREEKLREALAALPEDATEQDYLRVYRQWGSPDQMAKMIETGINARAKNAPKQLTQEEQQLKEYENQLMVDTVKEATDLTSEWSSGYGAALSFLPKSDARKLQGKLDTIKSDLAAAMISDMKSQSKTGATGLGALNKEELKVLQTARASLDAGMGADELKKSLSIINKYFSIRGGIPMAENTNAPKDQAGPKGTANPARPNVIKLD